MHPSITAEQAPAPDAARKIIIFTEHRDTLEYLAERIRDLLGRPTPSSPSTAGSGARNAARSPELFTQDADARVLVATDAAGEGLNLQRAHLMVNYDLPWNPNRIEQRFGRIHRIGQTEVCHLWNLVADGTREGMVFLRLLAKIEEQRQGLPAARSSTCSARPSRASRCKDLLVEAIRYGNRPEVRAQAAPGHRRRPSARAWTSSSPNGPRTPTCFAIADLEKWRARMDEANRRRLQPHYISAFFRDAFTAARRPAVRTRVRPLRDPPRPRRHPRPRPPGRHRPRPGAAQVRAGHLRQEPDPPPRASRSADLLAPGHPLLDAVTDLIIERYGTLLKQGTMLVDRHDPGTEPRLLVAVTHEITDGHDPARTITKKFGFVGGGRTAGCERRRGGTVPGLRTLG